MILGWLSLGRILEEAVYQGRHPIASRKPLVGGGSVGVSKVGGIFVQGGGIGDSGRKLGLPDGAHPCPPPTDRPRRRPRSRTSSKAIRQAIDAEIGELAANLATTDDAHLFGENEFKIRAIAHKIAAKAIEQHLARKKTDTKAPA